MSIRDGGHRGHGVPNRPAHDLTAPDARSLEAGDEWATRSIGTLPFPLGEHDLVRDVTSGDQRDRRDRRDAVGAFAGSSKGAFRRSFEPGTPPGHEFSSANEAA